MGVLVSVLVDERIDEFHGDCTGRWCLGECYGEHTGR